MKRKQGMLKKIDPGIVWRCEAHDFTPWLAENIQYLGEVLGVELEVISIETPVGVFSADIVAKDLGTNMDVMIEN